MKLPSNEIAYLAITIIVLAIVVGVYVSRLQNKVLSLEKMDEHIQKYVEQSYKKPPSIISQKTPTVGSLISYQYSTSLSDMHANHQVSPNTGHPDSTAVAYGLVYSQYKVPKILDDVPINYYYVIWLRVDILNSNSKSPSIISTWRRSNTDEAWNAKYLGVLGDGGKVLPPTINVELPVVIPIHHMVLLPDLLSFKLSNLIPVVSKKEGFNQYMRFRDFFRWVKSW